MSSPSFLENRHRVHCPIHLKDQKLHFNWLLDPGQLIDQSILHGAWEPMSTAVVARTVKPGMVAYDIGANIGYYTLLLSALVGSGGRVFAFEPMPEPFKVLCKHVDLNQLGNVSLAQLACSNTKTGARKLFNYSWPPGRCSQEPADVLERQLDDLGLPWPDFIKIDVDGYELKVLEGGLTMLSAYHPILLLEVCDYTLRDAFGADPAHYPYGQQVRKMLGLLMEMGYSFQYEEDLSPATSIDEVLRRYDLSKISTNLLCVPSANSD